MPERISNPTDCIHFTEHEHLYDRVSHQRLLEILSSPKVDIHEVKEDSNSFGEYLFVMVSCRTDQPRRVITFYGLGYHEQREQGMSSALSSLRH